MGSNFNKMQFKFTASGIVFFYDLLRALWLISVDIPAIWLYRVLENNKVYFWVLNSHPPNLYRHVSFCGPLFGSPLWVVMWCPCYTRAMKSAVDPIKEHGSKSWPTLFEFGLINDPLLFVNGCRWCRYSAKVDDNWEIKLIFRYP